MTIFQAKLIEMSTILIMYDIKMGGTYAFMSHFYLAASF